MKVSDALDKTWCDEIKQKADFRAESESVPQVRSHKWYENLCNSVVLEAADKVLRKKRPKKAPRRDVSQRKRALFAKNRR